MNEQIKILYKIIPQTRHKLPHGIVTTVVSVQECEQMRLERIWARQEKDKQIAEALAKFATMQINMKTRSESAKDNIIHDHVTTIR